MTDALTGQIADGSREPVLVADVFRVLPFSVLFDGEAIVARP